MQHIVHKNVEGVPENIFSSCLEARIHDELKCDRPAGTVIPLHIHCTLARVSIKNIPIRNLAVAILEGNACRWLAAIFSAQREYYSPTGAHNLV